MQALKNNNFASQNSNAGGQSASEVNRGIGNGSAAFIRSSYASVRYEGTMKLNRGVEPRKAQHPSTIMLSMKH
jgi:hypothetical protein